MVTWQETQDDELAGDELTTRNITVLLVDDSRVIGFAVRRMLADQPDITFHHIVEPTEALEGAKQVQPTVILQDLVMPGVDGLDLVRAYREAQETREVPLIVLSAEEDAKMKAEAFASGANDYMVKLPEKPEVVARIRYHSEAYIGRLQRNESRRKLEMRTRFIRSAFGRYMSDEVVTKLLEDPEGLRLGGDKRKLTVLMSDLRGFTALCDTMPAEQVVAVINNYLATMTDVILKHGGTIVEFLGDGIFVVFGAPEPHDDDTRRGVACALEMQLAMSSVNAWNAQHGVPEIEMGIGLNTGEMVIGNIGSERRAKYGVMGTQVNIAGRVESQTVGGQVLVSAATLADAGSDLRTDDTMLVSAKGVRDPITIYSVVGIGAPYNLSLGDEAKASVALTDPIKLRVVPLDGKISARETYAACFVRLGPREAELVCEHPMRPMTDLRLNFNGSVDSEDFYGKVLGRPAITQGAVVLRFTALPISVRECLNRAALVCAPRT